MEQMSLKAISYHMKDKHVSGDMEYGINSGNLCLTNLLAFYKEKVVDVINFTFSTVISSV